MEKKVMLSLVAMASTPLAGYADANLANMVEKATDAYQAGGGLSIENGDAIHTSPNGAPYELPAGELVPGSYTLTAGTKDENVKLSITVGGQDVAMAEDGSFTLAEKGNVVIKAESTDGKGFSVGGFTLTHVYESTTDVTYLTNRLNATAGKLNDAFYNERKDAQALKERVGEIVLDIERLKSEDNAARYAAYKEYELYNGAENSTLAGDIATLEVDVEALVAKGEAVKRAQVAFTELEPLLEALNANFEAATPYAKTKYADRHNTIKASVAGYNEDARESAYEDGTATEKYAEAAVTEFVANTKSAIADLEKGIDAANKDDAAYKEVAPQIAYATQRHSDVHAELRALLPEAEQLYADLFKEAQGRLAEAVKMIDDAANNEKTGNGNADNHDNAFENKDGNLKKVTDATTKINETLADYTGWVAAYEDAESRIKTELKDLLDAKKAALEAAGLTAGYQDQIDKIQGDIDALTSKIEKKCREHTITDYLADSLSEDIAPVASKITDLASDSNAELANFTAWNEMVTNAGAIKAGFEKNIGEVNSLVSEDENYLANGKYTAIEEDILGRIEAYLAGADKAKADKTAVEYQNANAQIVADINRDIAAYNTNAQEALDKYNAMSTALGKLETACEELRKTVKNPSVTTGTGDTYGERLAGFEAEINGFKKNITDASDLAGKEHSDAMIALDLARVNALITEAESLNDRYSTDEIIYNEDNAVATANALKTLAQGRLSALTNKIEEKLSEVTEENVGKGYADYYDQLAALQKRVSAVEIPTEEPNAGNAEELKESLAKIIENIADLNSDYEVLCGKIDEAAKNIAANKKNYEAAQALSQDIRTELDAVKEAYGDQWNLDDGFTPSNRKSYEASVMPRWNRLDAELSSMSENTIAAEIEKSYAAETLSTDWETAPEGGKSFKATLEEMKAEAKALVVQAKDEKANYDAYQALFNEEYSKIAGAINKAQDDLNDSIPDEGNGYNYYNTTVLNTLKAEKDGIEKDIRTAYEGYSVVAKEESLKGRIANLIKKLADMPGDAKRNEDAHTEQVQKGEAVMNEWSSAYAYISANDMSSKKDSLLNKLASCQDSLVVLGETVKTDWGKGESAGNGVMDKYAEISATIMALRASQNENYDEVITADNLERYKNFLNEVKSTEDTYMAAVETLRQLTSTVNPEYTDKIADIIAGSESIYDYSVEIRELRNSAKTSFDVTAESDASDLWDAEEKFKADATVLGEGINESLDNLVGKIYEVAKNLLVGTDGKLPAAEKSLEVAEAELVEKKYSDAVREAAFEDVKKLIKDVKQAEGSAYYGNNKEYVLAADDMLSQLDGVGELIKAGQQDAADAEWKAISKATDDQIAKDLEELNAYIEGGYIGDSVRVAYNSLVVETVDKAKEKAKEIAANNAGNLYEFIPEIKGLLAKFDEENPYAKLKAEAEASEDNKAAYTEMNTQIDSVQADLDALDGAAKKYYIYYDCAPTINNLQTRIDKLREKAEDAYTTNNAVSDSADVKKTAEDIRLAVGDARTMIDILECTTLKKEILNLRNLDTDGTHGATLDDLEARVSEWVLEDASADKQAALIALEKEIAAVWTELESGKVDGVSDALTAAIDAVDYQSVKDYLANCHEPVKTKEEFVDGFAAIETNKDAIKSDIEARKEDKTLLLYEDYITSSTEALKAELAALSAEIEAAEAPYVANDAAYERLSGDIAYLAAQKDAVVATINGYRDEVKNNPAILESLAGIQELIDKATASVDSLKAEIKLDESSTVPGREEIIAGLAGVERNAASSEASGAIADLRSAIGAVEKTIKGNNYSAETGTSLLNKCDSLKNNSIRALSDYHYYSLMGSVDYDIDGNRLVDENGDPVSLKVDFISEAVPAINAKIVEIDAAIKALAEEAESLGFIPGDLNRDGSVMVDDYNIILNVILERATIEDGSVEFLAADLNGDKRINIGDLTTITRIINGTYDASSKAKARRAAVASNDAVSLSVEGEGTKQRIAINLQNSIAYTGGQMDIMLPAGITLVGESVDSRAAEYALSSNDLDNGAHRIVLSSLDNVEIADGTGAIIYIDVEVAHSYAGEGIEVSDIMFTDAAARVHNLPGISGNEATGIGTVTVGEAIKSKIYSVSGRLMDGLKRGINIIRNSDGSTKKILVK